MRPTNPWAFIIILLGLLYFGTRTACAQMSVYITPRALHQLNFLFEREMDGKSLEFVSCLYGARTDTSYTVEWVTFPEQRQTMHSVHWSNDHCRRTPYYLAWAHAHPLGIGYLSPIDWRTLITGGEPFTLLLYRREERLYIALFASPTYSEVANVP